MRIVALSVGFAALCGCATNVDRNYTDVQNLLHDDAFPGSEQYVVETRDDVFELDADAKAYLDTRINSIRDTTRRGKALEREIFLQAAANLSYESHANTTASQTFRSQEANCLSMAILTYSMAEYVGFDATFQEVNIPEYWERRNNFSLMARHVNIVLSPKNTDVTVFFNRRVEIDFLPMRTSRKYQSAAISESRALAMFYNNKSIDALLAGNTDLAYAYLRAALAQDSTLDMALANLGLLYRTKGHIQWAEESYREAMLLNPRNAVAAENLAILLLDTDRHGEARDILARLDRWRQDNPYYLYILAEEAYDTQDWGRARRFYEKALAMNSEAHEFYFGLAKTYLQLGDKQQASINLRKAERYANFPDLKKTYSDKLAALRSL